MTHAKSLHFWISMKYDFFHLKFPTENPIFASLWLMEFFASKIISQENSDTDSIDIPFIIIIFKLNFICNWRKIYIPIGHMKSGSSTSTTKNYDGAKLFFFNNHFLWVFFRMFYIEKYLDDVFFPLQVVNISPSAARCFDIECKFYFNLKIFWLLLPSSKEVNYPMKVSKEQSRLSLSLRWIFASLFG